MFLGNPPEMKEHLLTKHMKIVYLKKKLQK